MSQLENLYFESVYPINLQNLTVLYELLKEREEFESISHTGMPTFEEHRRYVETTPCKEWWIAYLKDKKEILYEIPIGSYYISYKGEIGLSVYNEHRRKGYGSAMIEDAMKRNPKMELYANINPNNLKSIDLFERKFGFKHIQNTYKLEPISQDRSQA